MLTQEMYVVIHKGEIFKQRVFCDQYDASKYAQARAYTVANRIAKKEISQRNLGAVRQLVKLFEKLATLDPNDAEYVLDRNSINECIEYYVDNCYAKQYGKATDDVAKWEHILREAQNQFVVKPATITVT
jgi:hypothetical protein